MTMRQAGVRPHFIALVVCGALLAGCTGNGVQYARIANETMTTTGSVFIGRESQWIGNAVSVEVQLNGRPIAVLAQSQAVSSMARAGENVVTIIPTGPARLVYDPQELQFEASEDGNNYILIRIEEALPGFGGEIRVVETDPTTFATAVGS
jgi:hypothetical protein